jgi:hypothetical protein
VFCAHQGILYSHYLDALVTASREPSVLQHAVSGGRLLRVPRPLPRVSGHPRPRRLPTKGSPGARSGEGLPGIRRFDGSTDLAQADPWLQQGKVHGDDEPLISGRDSMNIHGRWSARISQTRSKCPNAPSETGSGRVWCQASDGHSSLQCKPSLSEMPRPFPSLDGFSSSPLCSLPNGLRKAHPKRSQAI